MIYEVRMTLGFAFKDGSYRDPRRFKTTLIEYIGAKGVAEAFNKAAKRKHEIIIDVAKGEATLWDEKAWGPRSKSISVSIDAVVAKPELVDDLKIINIYPEYAYGRVICVLNNGVKLRITDVVLEEMLERLKQKPKICDCCGKELDKAYADLGTDFSYKGRAMPVVARYIQKEMEKHLCSKPEINFYSLYIQYCKDHHITVDETPKTRKTQKTPKTKPSIVSRIRSLFHI